MPGLPSPIPDSDVRQFFMPYPGTTIVDGKETQLAPDDPERGWVKMDVSPVNTQDLLAMELAQTDGRNSMTILVSRIKEWNFEVNGVVMPINEKNVLGLGVVNLSYLSSQIKPSASGQRLTVEQKKT